MKWIEDRILLFSGLSILFIFRAIIVVFSAIALLLSAGIPFFVIVITAIVPATEDVTLSFTMILIVAIIGGLIGNVSPIVFGLLFFTFLSVELVRSSLVRTSSRVAIVLMVGIGCLRQCVISPIVLGLFEFRYTLVRTSSTVAMVLIVGIGCLRQSVSSPIVVPGLLEFRSSLARTSSRAAMILMVIGIG